jgi:hypothetical protein
MIINGFLVVRLPPQNEVAPALMLPSVNGIFCAGIDRCPWLDLFDEAYFSGEAPAGTAAIAKSMQDECVDFSGIVLAKDVNLARDLLAYSNRIAPLNEIIAIRSTQLDEAKGNFDAEIPIEWLGIDVMGEGEWSLLSGGLFAAPEHFGEWTTRINKSGMFDRSEDAAEYEKAYQAAVTLGRVEELAPPSDGFRILQIQVGRLSAS